jgi:NADPH-dependent glutamate synthase beta subunit-like oxidoreductase
MKSCIYQKQEPVNIPQAETSVLTEVLNYPFGFEIYSLLTRWNPLNVGRPHALPYNGKKVLVVGLGPAGYTLAHYLINEGFGVVGIDGLKIEPLPEKYVGSKNSLPEPIASYREIYEDLDDRILLGFGGVSEYGITVRWDKNFLKVIYIALARRRTFRIYDGVRFGGTVTIDDAWKMGFDHIAIATGAGKPTVVSMKNNLIRGIRQASDFLMALQLTGAYKPHALANLQVRMPALVIGGGLTGIDTATELMAYYPVQVERILARTDTLRAELGEEAFWERFTAEERAIFEEYIAHGTAIKAERSRAEAEGRAPNFVDLIRSWGGVSLVYRKTITDAPAYRLNHEEIIKALEEGIYFIENLSPVEAVPDENGAVSKVVFERQGVDEAGKWRGTGEMVTLPARSVMVAAGTSPNTIIDRENPTSQFEYDQWHQFFAPFMVKEEAEVAEPA